MIQIKTYGTDYTRRVAHGMADGLLLQLVWSLSGAHVVSLLPKDLLRPRREGTNCDTCDTMERTNRTWWNKWISSSYHNITISTCSVSPYSTLFDRCSPAPFHHTAPLQNKFGFIQVFPGLCHCLWGNCKGNKGTHEKLWNFGSTCKNMKENRKNIMFLSRMWIKHYWITVLRFLLVPFAAPPEAVWVVYLVSQCCWQRHFSPQRLALSPRNATMPIAQHRRIAGGTSFVPLLLWQESFSLCQMLDFAVCQSSLPTFSQQANLVYHALLSCSTPFCPTLSYCTHYRFYKGVQKDSSG